MNYIFKRECISLPEKIVFLFTGDCIFLPAEMYFFPDRVYFPSSKNLFLVLRERRPAGDKLLVHRQRQRPHLASILEHPSEHQEHKFSTHFESSAYWLYIWRFKKRCQTPWFFRFPPFLTLIYQWTNCSTFNRYQTSSSSPWPSRGNGFMDRRVFALETVILYSPPCATKPASE